jgi:O-antigen/teichoic acid export membrane protein
VIILPVFGGLFFVLPDMTSWLLGEEWRVVGTYIRWMLPWLYLSLLTGSTCYLSDVFMKQRIGLFFEILLAVCRILGLCIGIAAKDFTTAIAAYSISTAIAVLAQFVWLASLVRKYDREITVA